jgi:hypothetical protein
VNSTEYLTFVEKKVIEYFGDTVTALKFEDKWTINNHCIKRRRVGTVADAMVISSRKAPHPGVVSLRDERSREYSRKNPKIGDRNLKKSSIEEVLLKWGRGWFLPEDYQFNEDNSRAPHLNEFMYLDVFKPNKGVHGQIYVLSENGETAVVYNTRGTQYGWKRENRIQRFNDVVQKIVQSASRPYDGIKDHR